MHIQKTTGACRAPLNLLFSFSVLSFSLLAVATPAVASATSANLRSPVVVVSAFEAGPAVTDESVEPNGSLSKVEPNGSLSKVEPNGSLSKVDLKAVTQLLNSSRTFGEILKILENSKLATPAECANIRAFLQDRGVLPDTRLVKTKNELNSLSWDEVGFEIRDDGSLKNSNGQVLDFAEATTLDAVFGEAFLSHDKRSAHAKVMDLFMPKAEAASLPAKGQRATAALAATIVAAKTRFN